MGNRQPKITLEEQLRLTKREINKSIRELDRERNRLELEEKQVVGNIRQAAQKGDMVAAKMLARDLVRLQRHRGKFYQMRSQLQGVSLKLQTVKSTHAMSESLRTVAKVMSAMNKTMDVPRLRQIMKEFMKESEKLGLTEEMMGDAIEEVTDTGLDDAEVEDQVVNKVLDEIGVDLSQQLLAGPQPATHLATPQSVGEAAAARQPVGVDAGLSGGSTQPATSSLEKSLEERLKNLNA